MKAPIKIFGKHWTEVCPRAESPNSLALSVTRKLLMYNPDKTDGVQSASNESLAHFVETHPDGVGFTIRMPFDLWHKVQCALGEWALSHGATPDGNGGLKFHANYTMSPTPEGMMVSLLGFRILVLPRESVLVSTKEGRALKSPLSSGTMPLGNIQWGKTSDDGFLRSTKPCKDGSLAIEGQKDFRFGTGTDSELGKKILQWAKTFRGYALNPFGDPLEPADSKRGQNRHPHTFPRGGKQKQVYATRTRSEGGRNSGPRKR
jgi:hypothetical protein